jgi:hypothetical protein
MKLSYDLQQKLKKQYDANSFVEFSFKGLDIALKTDREGNPVTLFVGHKIADGRIKGERYARTYKKDPAGKIIKDHWDLKGSTT